MKCSFFSKTSLDIFKSFTAKFNIVGSTLTKNSFSKVFSLLNVTLAFTVYNPGLYVSTLFSLITILKTPKTLKRTPQMQTTPGRAP